MCVCSTDHWENILWDSSALIDIINRTESKTFSNKYEFLLDEKVVRLPLKSSKFKFIFQYFNKL